MTQALSRDGFERLQAQHQFPEATDVLTWPSLETIITSINQPGPEYAVEHPLTGELIVYCPARAKRPSHHNDEWKEEKYEHIYPSTCPICTARTTPVIASAPLESGGHAFVNENLFPAMSPHKCASDPEGNGRSMLRGAHLLLWPSTKHVDIEALSPEDHAQSFLLMQRLEEKLREDSRGKYLQVIKNTGALAGSSLEHGHYQIMLSNQEPNKLTLLRKFHEQNFSSYAAFTRKAIDKHLLVKEYPSVDVITPPWIRRPLEVMILPKALEKERLGALSHDELVDFATATSDIARALQEIMPRIGKEYAHNMMLYSCQGIGTLWMEVLPHTQITGGFEWSGLSLCQSSPRLSTEIYRGWL